MTPSTASASRTCGRAFPALSASLLRAFGCLAVLAMLAACAGQSQDPVQEAGQYKKHARGNYAPPGPPSDPWGPYISEASAKYDVPQRWIREVIRQESGGKLYHGGSLVTSGAGAMGLMQVMPGTFDELRARYNLGDDPYDPYDNIMAGTAYIRELYEIYGSPAFLAAYNAGPRRLDDYLSRNRALPDETRRYVARIGPNIADAHPVNRAAPEDYAMNAIPMDIPPGPRYGRGSTQMASASSSSARTTVQVAQLPVPPAPAPIPAAPPPPVMTASAAEGPKGSSRFRLIPTANAGTLPVVHGGPTTGTWAIQVGAFGNEEQAHAAIAAARDHAKEPLGKGKTVVAAMAQPKGKLYRARVTGLSRDAAMQACEKLGHKSACIVLSPDAQS